MTLQNKSSRSSRTAQSENTSKSVLESAVQASVIKELRQNGWYVIRLIVSSTAGHPDLMAIKQGRSLFVEVKRPGEQPTPLQLLVHKRLRRHGADVQVVDGKGQLQNL